MMATARFIAVSFFTLAALAVHELYSENLMPSHAILISEVGWWLVGALLIVYVLYFEKRPLSSIGINRISRSTLTTATIGFGLALLGVISFGIIIQITGLDPYSTESRMGETAAAPIWWLALLFIRAGIVEELFFRSFLISRATDLGAPSWLALLISIFLFTALHAMFWPAQALILIAFNGLALGLIFVWKRDFWACVIAHIAINIGGVAASLLA